MPANRRRLDAELVKRKIARSRKQAVEMIKDGRVAVNGFAARKPATMVDGVVSIRVEKSDADDWASRGAHKLLGAVEAFGIDFTDKRVLDAGASTGGFTDVALRHGAREVVAVDVGYGQLAWRLQNDPRVRVCDRTNVRHLEPDTVGGLCDVMVGDLSFISLRFVLPAIVKCLRDGAELYPMVKPQFEVGKDRLGSGGVVKSPQLRAEVTRDVAEFAVGLGLSCHGVSASPLPGPSGNVEYFLALGADGGASQPDAATLESMIDRAIEEGPR